VEQKMAKNLTTSQIDRQNILNNDLAIREIQNQTGLQGIIFEDKLCFTKSMTATYFDVDVRMIERYVSENVGNISNRTPQIAIFGFKAFLNIAMLLTESENAKVLRKIMLDIVIDFVNQRTGGSTKYINQRDQDFVSAFLQEENYRREFTDALRDHVDMGNVKYAIYTDKIYQSIFKEKAMEYKKILRLTEKNRMRDTLYKEIDIKKIENIKYSIPDKVPDEKKFDINKWRKDNPMDYLKAMYLINMSADKNIVFQTIYKV
jgi:hypothetical protein